MRTSSAHTKSRTGLVILLSAAVLAGCQTRPTRLGGATGNLLDRLVVARERVARPHYREVAGCDYRLVTGAAGGEIADTPMSLTIRPARDRLLIRVTDSRGNSTALIGSDGRMFDFNLAGFAQAANSETFPAVARSVAAKLRPLHGAESHVINELALIFPHFPPEQFNPGATAAAVTDENGHLWTRYVYRGTTSHTGRPAFLFELLRRSEAAPKQGEQRIGYSLVDRERMVPLLLVVNAVQKIHLQQVLCR